MQWIAGVAQSAPGPVEDDPKSALHAIRGDLHDPHAPRDRRRLRPVLMGVLDGRLAEPRPVRGRIRHAMETSDARRRSMSRMGGAPNIRAYSRLNCETLW